MTGLHRVNLRLKCIQDALVKAAAILPWYLGINKIS